MVQMSTAPLLLQKRSRPQAITPKFTSEQRAHFEKIAAQQKRIDDMATARELVQMFYAKEKAERNPWLREALNRIASKRGSGQANTIRNCMTAVRENEFENDITGQQASAGSTAPTVAENQGGS
jgi:CRISPR/Cas system-associated endonuclease Cas1